ncbi:hypothetical protein [Roseomonas xinghualingensis]|uniref:hypothetical protein n=1 Tax=Roseomonas xinghualingensis TaxID=2986475 RepID=UPI0021F24484|nr:hypothetical protein [Roseomonas sp. SXEYE001]MCV4206013.1 hypothetical protein [Roseomonas sp. SXEYE001]
MAEESEAYRAILARHERALDGVPYVHLVREGISGPRRLLVTIATHKNGERYAALETTERGWKGDVLALRDPLNSYYLQQDAGAAYDTVVDTVCAGYAPADVVFFGSSMAGYAALRWALRWDANAVVSNPQVNLDAAAALGWPELRANILRVPMRVNLDELAHGERSCSIAWLHGRHPMDVDALRRFMGIWLASPGMTLNLQHHPEAAHRYLINDGKHFFALLEGVLAERAMRERTERLR